MSSQPLVPVVEHLPDGIVQIALPTPFPVGPVNCYVLLDDPVTIVDPGLLWADSVGRLEEAMNLMGRRLVDVEQVLVTHGHPDHFGAAGWLAEKADATVAREFEQSARSWSMSGVRISGARSSASASLTRFTMSSAPSPMGLVISPTRLPRIASSSSTMVIR